MEVNVAIILTSRWKLYFGGRMYFVRGAKNSTRGRKYLRLGRGNISSPRLLCNGGDFIL